MDHIIDKQFWAHKESKEWEHSLWKKILQETLDRDMRSQPWEYKSRNRQMLLGNIYGETSAPTQTAFAEQDETINYFREHCNARGTHLIIHYPRNVGIMLIKMKGESHFHFLLRCTGLWRRLFGPQAEPGDRELSPGAWTSHLDQGWVTGGQEDNR